MGVFFLSSERILSNAEKTDNAENFLFIRPIFYIL